MPKGDRSRDGSEQVAASFGEVSEWLKEHAWKVCKRVKPLRGFESLSLRQIEKRFDKPAERPICTAELPEGRGTGCAE